jgi:hypothetical protein
MKKLKIGLSKQQRLDKAKRELDKTLNRTGYNDLKAKHGKVSVVEIPNYKVESKHALSNTVGNGLRIRTGAHHPDAKQFPIGNDHKSGYRLIVATDDLKYMAGKKT